MEPTRIKKKKISKKSMKLVLYADTAIAFDIYVRIHRWQINLYRTWHDTLLQTDKIESMFVRLKPSWDLFIVYTLCLKKTRH